MMDLKGDLVYNKDFWVLISGTFLNASSETVIHELKRAEKQLFQGINYFHKYKADVAGENELKSTSTNEMYTFLQNLETFLGINKIQAYDLLCYYVMYEFRGSVAGMQHLLNSDGKKAMLIHDIWLFYRSERMFLLKCINLIWTYFADEEHPFQKHYAEMISHHDLEGTFVCHASQLETLTNERMPTKSTHGQYMSERIQSFWFVSNLREQIDVIHNLILYADFYTCTAADFETLFVMCRRHAFGRDQQPGSTMKKEHEHLRETIGFMECVLLLQVLELESINSEDYKLFSDVTQFNCWESEIAKLGTSEEHGPLLVAWMVINYMAPHEDPAFCHYQRFGEKAVHVDAFNYLTRLLKHSMFKHSTRLARIAYQCVSKLLHQMTLCFESDILVCVPGIFGLVATVLTDRKVTRQFWNSDRNSGIWTVVNAAMKDFPVQYYPLVNIVESLASCGPHTMAQLIALITNMPSYIDSVGMGTPSLYKLVEPLNSYGSRTSTTLMWRKTNYCANETDTTLDWLHDTNFFRIIYKQLNSLLQQVSSGNNYVLEETTNQSVETVKCVHQLIENQCDITSELSETIGIVFQLLDKFSFHPRPSSELLGGCLNIASALLMSFPEMVCKRFKYMTFLPTIDILKCFNPIQLACGEYFNLNTVGIVMANHECLTGRYPLLLAYLQFLERVMEPNKGDTFDKTLEKNLEIILPGLILVVRIVFPNHGSWPYEDEMDKTWITHHCVRMLHSILSISATPVTRAMSGAEVDPKIIAPDFLHTICLYSLLETDTCLALLRLVATGDRYIQSLMERQPSWLVGNGILFISNVQLAMSVLNRVLLLKPTIHGNKTLCQIETLLYCQPTPSPAVPSSPQLRVVLVVANYIYHCFNPKLPVLAVKLLKRFATEFPISLMSCLGTDGFVICQSILSRLFSSIERNEFKVAVLELISASVISQPGLTVAFINLHQPQVKGSEKGGALVFACSILDLLLAKPAAVPISIHEGVVSLIYALWMGETQSVLLYLRAKERFWDGLLAPFFLDLRTDEVKVYCELLSIITLELFWYRGKVEKKLEKNLQLLFNGEEEHLRRFSEFIASEQAKKGDDGKCKPIVEGLVTAWKEFLCVSTTFFPFHISRSQKCFISNNILKTLVPELEAMNNPSLVKIIVDLYLHLITKWKDDCIGDPKPAVEQLRNILLCFSKSYPSLSDRCNEVVLSLIMRQLDSLYHEIRNDELVSDYLMQACCEIISLELLTVNKPVKKIPDYKTSDPTDSPDTDQKPVNSSVRPSLTCTLSVCLLQKLIFSMVGTSLWNTNFHNTKLVNQLLDVTVYALQNVETYLSLATVAFNTLVVLSHTKFCRTLMTFEVSSKIWLLVLPPAIPDEKPWYETEWVKIYEPALRLITSLLVTHRHHFVEDAISFVGIHHQHLMQILAAIRTSLHQQTLQMALVVLDFLRVLQEFNGTWQLNHRQSFIDLNRFVMATLDTVVAFLVQPHLMYILIDRPVLQDETDGHSIDSLDIEPSKRLNNIQNRLVECASMCLAVLYPLAPNFTELLTEIRDPENPRDLLIDLNFGCPVLHKETFGTLSFGTLVALTNICSEALAVKPGSYTPSPGRACSSPTRIYRPTVKWLTSLNRKAANFALELGLSFILSQGLVVAGGDFLNAQEKKQIGRQITSEMSFYLEYMKRNMLMEDDNKWTAGGNDRKLKRPSSGRKHCVRRLELSPDTSKQPPPPEDGEPLMRMTGLDAPYPIETLASMTSFMELMPPKMTLLNIGSQYEEYPSCKFFQLVAHVMLCIFK